MLLPTGLLPTGLLLEGVAEDLAEDVAVAVERIAARPAAAELEMGRPRPLLPALAEGGEGVAAALRVLEALEALEARLALGIDLATVEGGARLLVADHLIGLVGGGKALLGLRIVRVLVRMILFRELAIGRFYFLGRGVFGNAQHLIGVAHRVVPD